MKRDFFILLLFGLLVSLIQVNCSFRREMSPEQELMILESEEAQLEELQEEYVNSSINYLENLLNTYPFNPFGADAALRLGELYRIQAKNQFEIAMKQWEDGGMIPGQEPIADYSKAKQMYLRVISEYEGLDTFAAADAYYILASVLEEEGSVDSASILYRQLVERFPQSSRVPASCFRLGLYYFNFRHEGLGKIDLALDYFDRVMDYPTDPNYDKAIYMIGWLNRLAGEDSLIASTTYFLYLLELAQQEGGTQLADEAMMYLGFNFSEFDNGPMRMQIVLNQIGELPQGPDLLIQLAETYKDKIDYANAITTYQTFLNMYPNHAQAPFILRDMAALYAEVGDVEMAEASMDRLVESYGSGWEELAIGDSAGVSEQSRATDSLIREAMLFTAGVHHSRALQQGTPEEWRTTADRYQNFLEKYPDDPESYGIRFALAEAFYELQNYQSAGYQYTQVALDPTNDTLKLAAAYEAVTSYNSWHGLDTTDSERIDSIVEAASRYIGIWDEYPGDSLSEPVGVCMATGKVLYESGQYSQAEAWYRQVIDRFSVSPAVPSAAVMIAQCNYQMGNLAEAELWFNRAADVGGDTTLTKQAALIAFESASDQSDDDTLKAVSFIQVFHNYADREEGKKALFNAGVIFNNAGEEQRALEIFRQFVNHYDYEEDSLVYSAYLNIANISLTLAEQAQQEGNPSPQLWREAAVALEDITARYPETREGREAYLWSGRAYLGAGDYLQARQSFEIVANNTSFSEASHYEALHRLAATLDSLGLHADAMNAREQILQDYFSGGQAAGIPPVDIDEDMLEVADWNFKNVKGTILHWPINSSFPPYDAEMKEIAGYLTKIAGLKSGEVTIGALYLLGQCNEDYARAFREAEYDPSWSEEEQIFFQEELEMQALPYEDVAAQFYQAAIRNAEENDLTGSSWYQKTLEAIENLKIFRPDLFPEEVIMDTTPVQTDSTLVSDSTQVPLDSTETTDNP